MNNDLNKYLKQLADTAISVDEYTSTQSEEQDFEEKAKEQELIHRNDAHIDSRANKQQNRQLRLDFAKKLYKLTKWTLIVTALLITLNGVAHLFKLEFLSDKVIISLIIFSGTDMLGIFAIILTYLFNKDSS